MLTEDCNWVHVINIENVHAIEALKIIKGFDKVSCKVSCINNLFEFDNIGITGGHQYK